ncbi:MAG: RNA-binding domain-containing protein [Desulfurococcaceae archaeon]
MASSREAKGRKVEVSHVEITTFCHATEDCIRVEESIKNLLPAELKTRVKINEDKKDGYYGNPISILSLKIMDKQYIDLLIDHLAFKMDPIEKSILGATFDLRYDPRTGRFIVRCSKQDLYLGNIKISDTDDVIKLTIYLKNAKKKENAFEYLKSVGLIP